MFRKISYRKREFWRLLNEWVVKFGNENIGILKISEINSD